MSDEKGTEIQHERSLKYAEFAHAEHMESFKAVKEFGAATVKYLVTINGGGILALFAFSGNIASKTDTAIAFAKIAPFIYTAILDFSFGLSLAVFTSGIAYINFNALTNVVPASGDLFQWLNGTKVPEKSYMFRSIPTLTMWLAIIGSLVSLAFFLCGCYTLYQGLESASR